MPLDKRALYEAFRATLPESLRDDRFFKIFYSDVCPSQIAIIGLNPGGDPDGPLQSASCFYENDEHDYIDCEYAIAVKMRRLLLDAGAAADPNAIRRVPKLNVVFHRSPDWKALADRDRARDLARTHVAAILDEISPNLLLVEGFESFRQLMKQQSMRAANLLSVIPARLKTVTLEFIDGRHVRAVVLAHPTGSRWSSNDWDAAIAHVRSEVSGGACSRPHLATSLSLRETPSSSAPILEGGAARQVVGSRPSAMGNYASLSQLKSRAVGRPQERNVETLPTPTQALASLITLRGRGFSEEHFRRTHHRMNATRGAHEDYLRSIGSFSGPNATNLKVAQRMAWILQRLPVGGGFVEARIFNGLVTEALREYPK